MYQYWLISYHKLLMQDANHKGNWEWVSEGETAYVHIWKLCFMLDFSVNLKLLQKIF